MNLRIGIGLSFYNDFDSLCRMLQSLQSYPIDRIIAVDGRYEGHTGISRLSDKKTKDLFKSFQTPYEIIDAADVSQITKRQIYFDESQRHGIDNIIVMDSDEFVVHEKTNWALFIEELERHIRENKDTYIQGYTIPLYLHQKNYPPDYVINSTRLYHKPWELQYVDNHFTVRNKKTGVNMLYQTETTKLDHFVIGTDHKLRTKDYTLEHDLYEKWQQANEECDIKRQWRIDAFMAWRDSKQMQTKT